MIWLFVIASIFLMAASKARKMTLNTFWDFVKSHLMLDYQKIRRRSGRTDRHGNRAFLIVYVIIPTILATTMSSLLKVEATTMTRPLIVAVFSAMKLVRV